MAISFKKLSIKDGSFQAWEDDWTAQCEANDEVFDDYFAHLYPLIKDDCGTEKKNTGWFTLDIDGESQLICMLNVALIKGYSSPVLRVRHIYLSPNLDLGASNVWKYADAMSGLIFQIFKMSIDGEFEAKHIKIHVRSPQDLTFMKVACDIRLLEIPLKSVESRGNWLYIERNT